MVAKSVRFCVGIHMDGFRVNRDLRLKNYLLVTSTPVQLIDGPAPDGSVDSLRYRLREESNLDRICDR